jgi:hypothetical protein
MNGISAEIADALRPLIDAGLAKLVYSEAGLHLRCRAADLERVLAMIEHTGSNITVLPRK